MAEYFFNGQRSRLSVRTAYRDIFSAIVLFPLCWYLGWGDVRQRYVRTFLGPLWIIIGTGLWVAVMGFVMSALFGNSLRQTLPFIASGVIVWNFMANIMNEGCQLFIMNAQLIQAVHLPISVHTMRFLIKHIIMLAHNVFILILVFALCRVPIDANTLLVIPGLLLLFMTA